MSASTPKRPFPLVDPSTVDKPELAELIEQGNAVLACPAVRESLEEIMASPEFLQLERDLETLSALLRRAVERSPDDHAGRAADEATLDTLAARLRQPPFGHGPDEE